MATPSRRDIADLISDHPDEYRDPGEERGSRFLTEEAALFEMFGLGGLGRYFSDPVRKHLAQYLDKGWIKQYASAMGVSFEQAVQEAMENEIKTFKAFMKQYNIGPEEAKAAYDKFKKTGQPPKARPAHDERVEQTWTQDRFANG